MLDDKWVNSDGQNETLGGKEIITTASHLVCDACGMFILPVNSGQNSDIGKQLILLAELDSELLAFIMNPDNSIYTPNDMSQKVLDMLDHIVNSDLYGGSIFLMAQGTHDIMGPIILAGIGHLAPSIDVVAPGSLLTGMENMITRTGIKTNANPRYLDAEILAVLKADSEWYAGKVANGGFYKWQEEHKQLLWFLAEVATTAAYVAIMYASMTGQQRNQRNSSYERDIRDAEIGQSNRGTGNTKPGTLSNQEARQWYLDQESNIPNMIDTTKPLNQQAQQAFNLRNQFRTQARELMSDRVLAESLYKTDPNMTWEQIVNNYSNKGFSGDSLWQEIINAASRSRTSVNQQLGIK
jgi:filamentous hemagglutinin